MDLGSITLIIWGVSLLVIGVLIFNILIPSLNSKNSQTTYWILMIIPVSVILVTALHLYT